MWTGSSSSSRSTRVYLTLVCSALASNALAASRQLSNLPSSACSGTYAPSGSTCLFRGVLPNPGRDLDSVSKVASFTDCRNQCLTSTSDCASFGYTSNSSAASNCFLFNTNLASQNIKHRKKSSLIFSDAACYDVVFESFITNGDFQSGDLGNSWEVSTYGPNAPPGSLQTATVVTPNPTDNGLPYAAQLELSMPNVDDADGQSNFYQYVTLCQNRSYAYQFDIVLNNVSGQLSSTFEAVVESIDAQDIPIDEWYACSPGPDPNSYGMCQDFTSDPATSSDEITSQWQTISFTFTPAKTGQYRVVAGIEVSAGNALSMNFDNFLLQPN